MGSVAADSCTVCNKAGTRLCNRCRSTRYCSKACQKADWPSHKLLCATFSSFDVTSRPTDEHYRGFYFPVNEEKPKIVWFTCKWHAEFYAERYQHPDVETSLGSDDCPKNMAIQYNPVSKKMLSDTVYVGHRDSFLVDGSEVNKSVARILATGKPGQYHDWRGPIIAYGKVGLEVDPKFCKDIDMDDFHHITDFFLTYCYEPSPATQLSQQASGTMIKAVSINCIGDQKVFGKPHFEAIEVSSTDPIFSDHNISEIADRIGLPIFTRRCPPDPAWSDAQGRKVLDWEIPTNNPDASFLHLCIDLKAEKHLVPVARGWGWVGPQWQKGVGSMIVVRQDKKPLAPVHVEALCKYCRSEISPLLGHSNGEYHPDEPLSQEAVLIMICRPTFSICWYKLQDEKFAAGEGVSTLTPYDV